MTKYESIVVALAAALAALVYIARQVRRLAASLEFWGRLPEEHEQLMTATKANTDAIASLTTEVAWLRAAMMSARGRR